MSLIRKKQEEKNLKILKELLTFEGNRYCFDCNQRGATYVNVTIGSFVCTNCGGALRKYSHRLKSISMSTFSQAEMDFIKKRGNNICKKIYYGLCDHNAPPEMDTKNGLVDSHLRAKYELKKWYLEPALQLEQEALAQNQSIFDRVERAAPKPSKSYTINSSLNIIIEPSKQSSSKLSSLRGSRSSVDVVDNKSSHGDNTSHIDPSRLGGGSAIRLPLPKDNRGPTWLSSTDPTMNTQSPFADNFLFSPVMDSLTGFALISKSQTMNFSMTPLVPVSQGICAGSGNDEESTSTADKYAALAELDDLFSGTAVCGRASNIPSSPWGPMTDATHVPPPSNPFCTSRDHSWSSSNPFSTTNGAMATEWPSAPHNPFMSSTTARPYNPFL